LEHGFPIRVLAFGHGVNAVRAAGVVDENVQGSDLRFTIADFFFAHAMKFSTLAVFATSSS
jgi:hypothetical protein